MSIEYTSAVYDLERPVGLQRLLLLAIADHANDQGLAWPGNDCLVCKTKISERQIRRLIPELEAAGLLQIVQTGQGRGHRRIMRLLFAPATFTQRVYAPPHVDPKADKMTPFMDQKSGQDDPLSPADEGQTDSEKGTTEQEKGTNASEKGDKLPEVAGDNQLEPNNKPTTTAGGVDLDLEIAASVAERVEAPTPPAPVRPAVVAPTPRTPKPQPLPRPVVTVKSPYLTDPRKFKAGYIPAGQGSTPVEAWYESFSIHDERWRLSAPQEDDLVAHCPDLDRLRLVLKAYRQHGQYAPRNLRLVFDWYDRGIPDRDRGIPDRGGKASPQRNHEPEYDFSGYRPQLILPSPSG